MFCVGAVRSAGLLIYGGVAFYGLPRFKVFCFLLLIRYDEWY